MSYAPRVFRPQSGNKFYIAKPLGLSSGVIGNPRDPQCNVLSNTFGYAVGRFNEIIGEWKYSFTGNSVKFSDNISESLDIVDFPELGAMMYWVRGTGIDNDGTNGLIYLAIVEEINSETQIVTSESVTGGVPFKTVTRDIDNNWGMGVEYEFMGFIRNPLIETGVY